MNTTAKRFFKYTWQDPKFTKLTPEEKLMYKYIWESSDIAGVHQVHKAIMSACLGVEISDEMIKSLIVKVEDFVMLEGDRIWITSFIRYQQAETKKSLTQSPPHKSAVRHLVKAGIFQDAVSLDPELFKEYVSDSLPLPKTYSNGISSNSSSSKGISPSEGIIISTDSLYSFSNSIVEKYFSVDKEEIHAYTVEISEIIKILESKEIQDPYSYLEQLIREQIKKYGQHDSALELIRNIIAQK